MSRTDAFARDFCRRMRENPGNYNWECAGKPLGRSHENIDFWGKPKRAGKPNIFVEVELRRDAPLRNVVRIWRWIIEHDFRAPFVFVQAFSRYYKDGDNLLLVRPQPGVGESS